MIGLMVPSAFADEMFAVAADWNMDPVISIREGSSRDSESWGSRYFDPHEIILIQGEEAKWKNNDSVSHMIVSGTAENGPSGLFESGLISPNEEYAIKLSSSGVVRYFDPMFPWMEGKITVMSLNNFNAFSPGLTTLNLKDDVLDQKPIRINGELAIQCICLKLNDDRNWIHVNFVLFGSDGNERPFGTYGINYQVASDWSFQGNIEYVMGKTGEYTIKIIDDYGNDVASQKFKYIAESNINSPIEQKVESKQILSFVDPEKDPSHYVKRYITEPNYKEWFDSEFPNYTIWEGIGISQQQYQNIVDDLTKPVEPVVMEAEPEPEPEPTAAPVETKSESKGGGCLIATAAYGSEMAPQVQFLREIRDNTVLQTQSGTSFMTAFNTFYYTFSPAVADYERENPVFKEAVKIGLTPLLTSLTILNYVDIDTEQEMLGYGIGIIMLNIGMYFVAPAVVIIAIKKRFKA